MNKRLISAAAASAALALTLTACSEAEEAAKKAADDATGKAADAAKSAASNASGKAADAAKSAAGELTGKDKGAKGDASGSAGAEGGAEGGAVQGGGLKVDLGDYSDDPSAMAVGDFYTARQDALADGDTTEVAKLVTPAYLKKVEKFVAKREGKKNPYQVKVTGVEGTSVDACVGPKGDVARTITVKKGKVAGIAPSDATC